MWVLELQSDGGRELFLSISCIIIITILLFITTTNHFLFSWKVVIFVDWPIRGASDCYLPTSTSWFHYETSEAEAKLAATVGPTEA